MAKTNLNFRFCYEFIALSINVVVCCCLMKTSEEVDWDQQWNPRLIIENVIGEAKDTAHMSFTLDRHGRATVCESRRVQGNFFEFMELNSFPFDSQVPTVMCNFW